MEQEVEFDCFLVASGRCTGVPGPTIEAAFDLGAGPLRAFAGTLATLDGVRRWRAETFGGEIVAALGAP